MSSKQLNCTLSTVIMFLNIYILELHLLMTLHHVTFCHVELNLKYYYIFYKA